MPPDDQIRALTPEQLEQLATERERLGPDAQARRLLRTMRPGQFDNQRADIRARVASLLPWAPPQARLAVEDALLGEFLAAAVATAGSGFNDPTGVMEATIDELTRPWRVVVSGGR
jgi:hypothetical protein